MTTRAATLPRSGSGTAYKPDILRLALFAFIVVVISSIHMYVPVIALFRPGMILWLVIMVVPLVMPKSIDWKNLTSSWPPKLLMFIFFCVIFSIPFGLSSGQSGKFFLDVYSRVLLFAVVLMVSIRTVRELHFFIWSYVASIGILTVLALTIMQVGAVDGGLQRLQGEYVYDSNDMGVLFSIGLPLALLTMQTSGKWGSRLSLLIVLGIPATIAKFGSRGAFLGLVAVGITLFFSTTRVALWKRVGIIPVLAGALFFAAPAGYWEQMGTILNPGDDYNLTEEDGRKALVERGLVYMSKYPVFGVGLSNFGRAEGTIAVKAADIAPGVGIKWTAPHNTYIQVGAELGVMALLSWFALIGGGIFGVRAMKKRIPERWATGVPDERVLYYTAVYLPAAFVGFAVPATFVSHTYLPQFYILVAYMAAFFVMVPEQLRRGSTAGGNARTSRPGHRWHPAVLREPPPLTTTVGAGAP